MDKKNPFKLKAFLGGFFNNARHFTIKNSTMIENVNLIHDNHAIKLLEQEMIPGAAFDSAERYPPPRCHPGTRLNLSKEIHSWTNDLSRTKRVLWLHGPAGVGKSAIIQTLAESDTASQTSILGATIFFSRPNERNDPQRLFITIAYQLAVKYPPYRQYVEDLVATDPNVVKKSLTEQFKWFIAKPFAERKLLKRLPRTILVLLDGLDECMGELAQEDIVLLISKFALDHPTSPLIWLIASRPEPQIHAAFSHDDVLSSYVEVDVPVDSDDACADVERYLRDQFTEIRRKYSSLFPLSTQHWPTETEFSIIAKASSGLFVFSSTVIRFIGDTNYGNPVLQFKRVLDVIESTSSSLNHGNPFATLDALYAEILATIPQEILPTTERLLAFLLLSVGSRSFIVICNLLGLSQADAYGALRRLHSVLNIPPPEKAVHILTVFHASFTDYLSTPSRSGSFWINKSEARKKLFSVYSRVLLESHNAVESSIDFSRINLSWSPASIRETRSVNWLLIFVPFCDVLQWEPPIDEETQDNFRRLAPFFKDFDFGRLYEFSDNLAYLPLSAICNSAFRPYLEEWGIIQNVPIESLSLNNIRMDVKTCITCFKADDLQLGPGEEDLEWSEGENGIFGWVKISDFTDMGDWRGLKKYEKALPLCEDSRWKDLVWRNLSEITDVLPSYPIMSFGKGRKSGVLAAAGTPGQFWIYYIPYCQPS